MITYLLYMLSLTAIAGTENLLQSPSFEGGPPPGVSQSVGPGSGIGSWTVTGDGIDWLGNGGQLPGTPYGANYLRLRSNYWGYFGAGGVSQTVNVIPGESYVLSVWARSWHSITSPLIMSAGSIESEFNMSYGWTQYQIEFTPTESTVVIEFRGVDDNSNRVYAGPYVDLAELKIIPPDSDNDGTPDSEDNCYLYNPEQTDCNQNEIGDVCDLSEGTSLDCNSNQIPDECDIADGTVSDCNDNGIPDLCDITDGVANDCNANGIPDDCDIADGIANDCNANGIPDSCDLTNGSSDDLNNNNVPDECECLADVTSDAVVDIDDVLVVIALWDNDGGQGDVNYDGYIGADDILAVLAAWGPCP